jgi:hypothetical protein
MAGYTGQLAQTRPSTVAVHDHGKVLWQFSGIDSFHESGFSAARFGEALPFPH